MKISFLSFYSGKVDRGVETFVFELGNGLVDLGYEVEVFQSGVQTENSKFKTIKIDEPDANIRRFTSQALKKIDPGTDIIFPTNGRWQSLLCKVWAIKMGKKMIISGQSGPGFDDRFNLWTIPDVFVSLTDYQKKWAKNVLPLVRTVRIPNGVNLEKFNSKTKPIKTSLAHPIVLCVGALESNKRTDLVIKAVSKTSKMSLMLVGKGTNENNLRKMCNDLMPGRFEILSVKHNQMPSVYASADVATFATVPTESFGIVLVEAMASGLPVVATDDPIRREIVGAAGSFVDVQNSDFYAKALDEATKKKWGDSPRAQAEKFSWAEISSSYDKLFKSLLKK